MTKTLHETLLAFELRTLEIPRPQCKGLEFVPTRGRQGFYKSIRNEGHKYGLQIKSVGPRRPTLPKFWIPSTPLVSSSPSSPQINNENQEPATTKLNKKTDANANELLPLKQSHHPKPIYYSSILEEPDILEEPEPDYDDKPSLPASLFKSTGKIPEAPPLPEFLFKRTIRF